MGRALVAVQAFLRGQTSAFMIGRSFMGVCSDLHHRHLAKHLHRITMSTLKVSDDADGTTSRGSQSTPGSSKASAQSHPIVVNSRLVAEFYPSPTLNSARLKSCTRKITETLNILYSFASVPAETSNSTRRPASAVTDHTSNSSEQQWIQDWIDTVEAPSDP
jgi:hypothetical protein